MFYFRAESSFGRGIFRLLLPKYLPSTYHSWIRCPHTYDDFVFKFCEFWFSGIGRSREFTPLCSANINGVRGYTCPQPRSVKTECPRVFCAKIIVIYSTWHIFKKMLLRLRTFHCNLLTSPPLVLYFDFSGERSLF